MSVVVAGLAPDMSNGRLRNHDLLTSLDVLTTGSYRRLPTGIKVFTFMYLTTTCPQIV